MLTLAFPQPGWRGLVFVALAPAALAALRSERPWRLAWTGYVVGLAWWLFMLRWLTPVTVPGWAALCVYLSLYWPAAALLWRLLGRNLGMPGVLFVPLVWTSLELLRASFLSGGFGWLQLGHAVVPTGIRQSSQLIQVADLFGEWGVSFLAAMTSGLLVDVLTRSWSPRKGDWRRSVMAPVAIWAAALAAAGVYGGHRLRQPLAADSIRVAVVQTAIPQSNKNQPNPQQEQKDWQRQLDMLEELAVMSPRPRLIVLPETTTPEPINSESLDLSRRNGWRFERVDQQLACATRRVGAYVLVGSMTAEAWSPSRQGHVAPRLSFNSTYLYRPDGAQDGRRYDKVHRVPFGEYIPWVDDLPGLKDAFFKYLSPYDFDYTIQAGRATTVFRVRREESPAGIGVVSPICFEDTDAPLCRRMVYGRGGKKQAQLIVNPSNEAWFADVLSPMQGEPRVNAGTWKRCWPFRSYERQLHLQMAALRCVENRVPMARSVNSGLSGFIDSRGRVIRLLDKALDGGWTMGVPYDWAIGVADLPLDGRATVYGRVGNLLGCLAAVWTAVLAGAALGVRPRSAAHQGKEKS